MLRLALVIALLPTIAVAEDGPLTLSSQDEWLNRIAFRDLKSDFAYSVHAAVGAQAGRVTGAQANAGGEIAWDVGPCKALVAGGEGAQDNEQSSGSLWGGFCIPFPMNRFELVLRTDYLLQPSLSSAPIALRARYSGISVQMKNTFIGWRDDDVEHAILPVDIAMGTFEQEGVDTGSVSMGLGMCVLAAARAASSGASLQECEDAAHSVAQRVHVAVAFETLEYLRRGGRIGRASAFLGGLLRLQPVLTVKDGEAFPVTRARSRQKAIDELCALVTKHERVSDIAIAHTTTPDEAEALAERVRSLAPDATLHEVRFGPVLGTHGGPGMLGVAVVQG